MSNSLGDVFRMTSFGESHGHCIGVVIDGCPAGLHIEIDQIQKELDRRRPGQSSVTTSRREGDKVEVISGIFNGYTTGAPICMLVWNKDVDSSEYEKRRWTPRPGHADFTAHVRYGGFNDYRGGGRFSGRLTAGFVMAGAIAKKLLAETIGVEILAHTVEIGGVNAPSLNISKIRGNVEGNPVRCAHPETSRLMVEKILSVAEEGDSVGGVIECIALNLPAGVGEPIFGTLEGDLASALFAIPAVKAVEFGVGRNFASLKGSESNDQYSLIDGEIKTTTNKTGGILVKKEETILETKGRHDPCIVPRAVPVAESMVAVVLTDHAIRAGLIPKILEGLK
jgi:chorismate synthase